MNNKLMSNNNQDLMIIEDDKAKKTIKKLRKWDNR